MGYQNKPVAKWQKAVADWRSKVKGKAASIKRGLSQTGGDGPSCVLNENELRLLAIIGTIAVIGVTEVERGIVQEEIPTTSSNEEKENISLSPPPLMPLLMSGCGEKRELLEDGPKKPSRKIGQWRKKNRQTI
ncbi:uncharacterized protein LOC123683226 [Harmonia axyridis]|uniref:uncharacterized protein LOC123683226 n=1 Tax=Harmonia axyridis TaxID=115357 RepID=UPI001E2762AA|nr:uncharacterized protein LOC123683226 [Harmonia axyridis]